MAYKIIKSAGGVQENADKCEIMIESASDLDDLPSDLASGSVAYTASLSIMCMKGLDGNWAYIVGGD